ncbi:MAG: [FeFe] hydrogenase H-cluster radical SAM maturase HydG [Alphaproteobacteria bacterium]|nr:[FeFe] hydrogenase H-cluster radical SAM maturase HydG [Alphaproteobacteria bacterium]
MKKYDIMSDKAQNFINPQRIEQTLRFAYFKAQDKDYLRATLHKANAMNGLNTEQATALLLNQDEEITEEIFSLAAKVKSAYYGNRIVLFAPLYLSNYCVNHCLYCPYHQQNKHIERHKMSQEEIKAEVIALQDMGHKRLALELGEDEQNNPLEYVLESIDTIYGIHHKAGAIRRVNVNIAATTIENYKRLHEAKIGTYILFQETYNKASYERLHPQGPKADYAYHTEAMDRAMQAGIEDVGLGVLFGLNSYAYEFAALLDHAAHLEKCYGAGPHTISVPRLRNADGINAKSYKNALPDDIFLKIIALLRLSVPYTGLIISTREPEAIRLKALELGISQISGGSKTSVGGYAKKEAPQNAQFEVADHRTLDEVVGWLMENGHIPSFCTACYGKGRQGEDFMEICKKRQIHNFCTPNALLTLAEYLNNYASPEVKAIGKAMFAKELSRMSASRQALLTKRLSKAEAGTVEFL